MNLFRFVRGIGLTPLVCGNIKGLQDPYRTPTTQAGFAEQWGQDPHMVTSFADGTKISLRAGHRRQRDRHDRGAARHARRATTRGHVDELTDAATTSTSCASSGGVVDYVVGSQAGPGRLRAGHARRPEAAALPQPVQAGRGPAVQLLHARTTCATSRCRRPWPAPCCSATRRSRRSGAPTVEVVTTAKRDLAAGDVARRARRLRHLRRGRAGRRHAAESLLPMGVAEGCRSVATWRRTRCSPTTTSTCRRAASSTSCGRRRRPSCPFVSWRGSETGILTLRGKEADLQ